MGAYDVPLREGYCKEWVGHGRMGLARCTRKATGDDGLCTQHRQAKKGGPGHDVTRPPSGEPRVVAYVSTFRQWVVDDEDATTRESEKQKVELSWQTGEGPVFPAPYRSGTIQWDWLSASRRDESSVEYDGRGRKLKVDGTPGQEAINPRWIRAHDLPEDVRALLLEWLEKVHG